MKNLIRSSCWLIFILIFAQTTISGFGFSSTEFIGKVVVKNKGVVVDREGETLAISSFGKKLKSGDMVVTGDSGRAEVIMNNGDVILLAPWSKLTILKNKDQVALKKAARMTLSFAGKIRAKIKKSRNRRLRFKSANAEINIKGTEFIAEYANKNTIVATLEGLVNISSVKTGNNTDIPAGKMSSVSAAGEVMPLSEIAGEILKGVESAGEKMTEEDVAGKKM